MQQTEIRQSLSLRADSLWPAKAKENLYNLHAPFTVTCKTEF